MPGLRDYLHKFKRPSVIYSLPAVLIILVIVIELYLVIPIYKSSKEKKGEVEIYYEANISNAHLKIIHEFNEIHKGKIKVIPVDISFKTFNTNERKELLTRSLRNKSDRMDIFEVDLIWVKRFAKWCLPLSGYFSKEEQSKFLNNSIASCYYDSTLVAIPYYFDIGVLYYRDDLLRKISSYKEVKKELEKSITWKDFIKLSNKFRNSKNPFYVFSAEDYEGLVCFYLELVLSQNKNFFNEKKIDLTRPECVKALNLLVDLVWKDKISPTDVTDFNENSGYEYFLKKNAVFFRGWPNFKKDDRNLYQDSTKTKYLVKTALPHFAGNTPGFVIGGWNLMVSKYTPKKEEIKKFLKFIVSEKAQKILYEEGGYLPTLKKFYTDENLIKKYPELIYIKYLMNYGVHRPFLEDYTRISDIISHYVQKAIEKEITVKQALSEASKLINSNKILIK